MYFQKIILYQGTLKPDPNVPGIGKPLLLDEALWHQIDDYDVDDDGNLSNSDALLHLLLGSTKSEPPGGFDVGSVK